MLLKTNKCRSSLVQKGKQMSKEISCRRQENYQGQNQKKTRSQSQSHLLLFSENDIRRFVTEFVSSWIRGDIIIRFPTAAELAKKTPLSIAFPTDPSVNAELKIKEHYIDLLSVVAGIKPASAEEQEKAINEVFKMLLMFRSRQTA